MFESCSASPSRTSPGAHTSSEGGAPPAAAEADPAQDFAATMARADAAAASGEPYVAVQGIRDAQAVMNHCEGRLVQLTQALHATYQRQLMLRDSDPPEAVVDLLDAIDAALPEDETTDTQPADVTDTTGTAAPVGGTTGPAATIGEATGAAGDVRRVEHLAKADPDVGDWYAQVHKEATRMVAAEVAAAVGWSPREANWAVRSWVEWTGPAERLLVDAMTAGELEVRKANVIATGIAPMTNTDDQVRVCQLALPRASALPRRRLERLVSSLVTQLDPEAIERRHSREVDDRAVLLEPGNENTAVFRALGVPPDQAAAAYARVDALARRARAAGDARTLNQLRCDLTIALLAGTAQFHPQDDHGHHGPIETTPPGTPRSETTPEPAQAEPARLETAPPGAAQSEAARAARDSGADDGGHAGTGNEPVTPNSERAPSPTFPLVPGETPGRAATLPDTILTVPLHTLLTWFGTSDTTETAGTAPTDSDIGTATAADPQTPAPRAAPETPAPPRAPTAPPPVEADRIGPLLDTVAHRVLTARLDAATRDEGEWRLAVTDTQGRVVQYHALGTRTLRGLRREAMAIDQRWCVFPTCTKPALRCQADHATHYAHIHETRLNNMEPLCAPDHTVKTAGGYHIQRTNPHDLTAPPRWHIVMRSGHHYPTPNPTPPTITDPAQHHVPAIPPREDRRDTTQTPGSTTAGPRDERPPF